MRHSMRVIPITVIGSVVLLAIPGVVFASVKRVIIENFVFSPKLLTIKPGDTVIFVNKDVVPHTATAKNKSWDTGNLNQGQQKSIVMKTVGSYDYKCIYHPDMVGRIVVKK